MLDEPGVSTASVYRIFDEAQLERLGETVRLEVDMDPPTLQALVTLNDRVYLEAARNLALRLEKENTSVQEKIKHGYEKILGRAITKQKLDILENLYHEAVQHYQKDKASAAKILGGDEKNAKAESAALVIVANVMMNLDEFVTKS